MMGLKEPVNGLLHLIGAVLAIPACVLLIIFSAGSPLKIVAFSIYGVALFLLYLFSTLYHWLPKSKSRFQVFRKLDHLSIYALIAGTYTPFSLLVMRGVGGWVIFAIIWAIAITGITLQAIFIDVPRLITTIGYILMGWLVLFDVGPLIAHLPANGLYWLLAGGIIYSLGGVVYVVKKPNLFKYFGYHELWHCFVLLGSSCHFIALLFYVALVK